MCDMPFHPSPSPSHHLAVRTTQRRSGSQTCSLCSQLLCHAADKTSVHISLKERKDLRDFRSLSLSPFLEFPLFIHLPPPFFCISHSVPPTLQCIVYILRRQFPSELQTFPAIMFFFFLVSPTSQSGLDGVPQTLKVVEGEEISKLREQQNKHGLRERRENY